MYGIKERLALLGKSQVWLMRELRKLGYEVQPPQLSNIINGNYTYPKATVIAQASDLIIAEVEKNDNCRASIGNG
jgi:hypothetical protein